MIDTDKKYSKRDLELAQEMGGITRTLIAIKEKIDLMMQEKNTHHSAMWNRIDEHGEKLITHHGLIKWIIGVGTGVSAVFAAFIYWLKHMK